MGLSVAQKFLDSFGTSECLIYFLDILKNMRPNFQICGMLLRIEKRGNLAAKIPSFNRGGALNQKERKAEGKQNGESM